MQEFFTEPLFLFVVVASMFVVLAIAAIHITERRRMREFDEAQARIDAQRDKRYAEFQAAQAKKAKSSGATGLRESVIGTEAAHALTTKNAAKQREEI